MRSTSSERLVGQMVDKYRLQELLSYGPMSVVYRARHLEQRNPVALTLFILPELSASHQERFKERFLQEASVLTGLRHNNILPLLDYGDWENSPYFITPFIPDAMDISLATILEQQKRCPPGKLLPIVEQIVAGLEHAHCQGIIHGGLCTAHILKSKTQPVQITRLGWMHLLDRGSLQSHKTPYPHVLTTASTLGIAPAYIAPECLQGQEASIRSDVYSLGVVIYELLSGTLPFAGGSALEIKKYYEKQAAPSLQKQFADISPELEKVIEQAIAINPKERFQRVSDLLVAFAKVVSKEEDASGFSVKMPTVQEQSTTGGSSSRLQAVSPEVTTGNSGKLRPFQPSGPLPGSSAKMPAARSRGGQPCSIDAYKTTGDCPKGHTTCQMCSLANLAAPPAATSTQVSPTALPAPTPQAVMPVQPLPVIGTEQMPPVPTTGALAQPIPSLQSGPLVLPDPGRMPPPVMPPMQMAPPPGMAMAAMGPGWNMEQERGYSDEYGLRSSRGRKRGRRRNKISRRQVVALLLAGGGLAVGGGTIVAAMRAGGGGTGGGGVAQTGQTVQNGNVIGSVSQAINTAIDFKNPRNGQPSWLVRLPSGKFVAYEKACTHVGVYVNYDTNSHQFICPAHGAIFDPAQGGKVLRGPATVALPEVPIKTNTDGSITVV